MKMFKKMKKGFTLVELIIVMVILGALAAIAIPKMGGSTDGAVLASVKSDLRTATVKANELYSKNLTYGTGTITNATLGVIPSPGNTIAVTGADTTFSVTVSRTVNPCTTNLTYNSSTGAYTSTTGKEATNVGEMPTLACGTASASAPVQQ